MTNILRYPLRNISDQTLRELQEHYPDAQVQIKLSAKPQNGSLTEAIFWDLIAKLDWTKEGDDRTVILPVVKDLANFPLRYTYDFADILSHKLYLLDNERYAANNTLSIDEDFSADRFLYSRCCVIANGRAFFEHIRKNPDKMPHHLLFAPLLRIPNAAHQLKLGKPLEHVWAYPVETFSNTSGWASFNIQNKD